MGVNGLWNVVQPCARPTNLATLNRKRLAVDASIWIYQFLKAVRDKEGNALRNSHVVGFFRRICKLLWFGIQPVFVFDGGAPALKRQTISKRKRRREGRREDAVRTAGKLLAVQMHRIAEEEGDRRRRKLELESQGVVQPEKDDDALEELPDPDKFVYLDELGMSKKEREKNRRFYKQDAYHLPDLHGGIESMGKPEDPRIMSIEELEEYARQFNSGEDINLYDFSKIDFEGDFFKSLPPQDRYNILNAARLRSRLRMGLSKDQLDTMFPDRMAFSRFQIERVKERNHLTQRLMKEAGMTGTDLTLGVNGRIAGEKDREYILVKNDNAEGGWALGVVSTEKDRGEIHKPIDVDALDFQYQPKEEDDDWEDDDEFEDVPIEGLNRLPKITSHSTGGPAPQQYGTGTELEDDADEALFVPEDLSNTVDSLFEQDDVDQSLVNDEEEDINRAIAMSLKNQHGVRPPGQEEWNENGAESEDVTPPEWSQKAVEQSKPITTTRGSAIAHIINSRANVAVSKPKPKPKRKASDADSDSGDDFQVALSRARKRKKASAPEPQPSSAVAAKGNSFGGPLPFEKLDWKSSIFAKKSEKQESKPATTEDPGVEPQAVDDLAGGFERDAERDAGSDPESEGPRPLPPWMAREDADIRDTIKAAQAQEREVNEADRQAALEEDRRLRRDAIIEIQSSDDESDVEVIDPPPPQPQLPPAREKTPTEVLKDAQRLSPATLSKVNSPVPNQEHQIENSRHADTIEEKMASEVGKLDKEAEVPDAASDPSSPEPEFEEVEIMQPPQEDELPVETVPREPSPESTFEMVPAPLPQHQDTVTEVPKAPGPDVNEDIFSAFNNDDFSDPEDDELLAQMAEEAEEHARFASQLNNRSEEENREAYERELRALRTQQRKDRRDADEVTQTMVAECQALLRLFGIPYVTAPMEAEAQCAELVRLGLVDGIVTDDSDIFLFGGTRVYKNVFNGNKFVECYLVGDFERELSLPRERLVSLAQLLGSDYAEGLPGVGPVTAVEILSEFPGRDGLAQFRDWWSDVQSRGRALDLDRASPFRRKFRRAQAAKLFLPTGFPSPAVDDAYLQPEVDADPQPFQWGVPDVEGLRLFLMDTVGWSRERTDEVLVPVVRDMNRRDAEGTQSNITRFFEGGVGVGADSRRQQPQGTSATGGARGEAFAPRRNQAKGSKRMAEAVSRLRAKEVAGVSTSAGTAAATLEVGDVEETGQNNDINDSDFVDDDDSTVSVRGVNGARRKSTGTQRTKRNGRRQGKGKPHATSM